MEKVNITSNTEASVSSGEFSADRARIHGRFCVEHHNAQGELISKEFYDNTVTDVGAKAMMDTYLAGSAYTAAFYLGLISSVSYASAPVPADTAASHAGWTEAGAANAPAYSSPSARGTAVWTAATGSGAGGRTKAMNGVTFTFSSGGTVKGSFLSTSNVKDGTSGTMFSAGLFAADKVVSATDTLTITYQLTL